MGRPEDLMGAVTFLSSDASLYVTVSDFQLLDTTHADNTRARISVLTEHTLALKCRIDPPAWNASMRELRQDLAPHNANPVIVQLMPVHIQTYKPTHARVFFLILTQEADPKLLHTF
jgi:hypothetical protein